jgi:hypothetical protein
LTQEENKKEFRIEIIVFLKLLLRQSCSRYHIPFVLLLFGCVYLPLREGHGEATWRCGYSMFDQQALPKKMYRQMGGYIQLDIIPGNVVFVAHQKLQNTTI